jgi:NADP-dependent alcohol dehydrogenase
LQYAQRIWGISTGTVNERIDAAIAKTAEFFESLGLPTTLPAYDVTEETVNRIIERFNQRGYLLGEKRDIGPAVIESILLDRM